MSFRALSRDETVVLNGRDPEMEVLESPRKTTNHSRNQSESGHLLPSPKNLFEYSTTTNFRFNDVSRQSDRRFPDWSDEPQTLRRSRRQWWRDFVVDAIMVATGLPFFALAGAVIRLNGRVIEGNDLNVLEQCIRAAATLFPLVFSVVVGRASVKLASWKLERGTTLGLLERLMGSRTVGSTIITQLRLQSWSLIAVGLILVWSLSPLGSQAALRIMSTGTGSTTAVGNITYFSTRQPSYSGYRDFFDSWFSGFAALFSASLLASDEVKLGSMDLWGNVKIPYFSSLANVSQDSDGWRQVPPNTNTTIYSSLFGVPISGLPIGNTTFNIESTYLELTCENITTNITRDPLDRNLNFYNPGLISTTGPFSSAQNITDLTPWALGYLGPDVTALLPPRIFSSPKCLDCLPDNVTSMTFFPGLLLYQDFEGAQNVTSIYCAPSQAYVESSVVCTKGVGALQSCAVTAQRLSTLQHMPTTLTSLSFAQTFTGLSALLPNATQQTNNIDLLQNYLANPLDNAFIQSAQWPAYSPSNESRFLNLPLPDFSARLGQVINTFLIGSMLNSTSFLTSPTSPPLSSTFAASPAALLLALQNQSTTLTVPAPTTSPAQIYKASYPWLIIFLITTATLPILALLSAILKRKTLTRDYLGYASSLARESQYSDVPKGGVNLDGLQRTRGLSHLRIRLGDVGDVERGVEIGTGVALSVGQLAVAEVESARRVDERKLYI